MPVTLGFAHNLPPQSYPLALLQQLGIAARRFDQLEAGFEAGYRWFWWSQLSEEALPTFEEPILVVADNRDLGCPAVPRTHPNFTLSDPELNIEKVSFWAKLPFHPAPGTTSGMQCQKYSGGYLLGFPWSLAELVQGRDWGYRYHRMAGSSQSFMEIGPDFDYASFRRLFYHLVRTIVVTRLKMPLLHRSWKLEGGPYYGFRLDGDNYDRSLLEVALEVAGERRFTWFLRMERWREPRAIERLIQAGQDVQLHGYHHHTYRSKWVNRINLELGRFLLRRAGARPDAAVSPFGYYFPGWSEALQALGCDYSSEFAYSIDDLPSFPQNAPDLPLQIPVHPACTGLLAHCSEQEIQHHFQSTVNEIGSHNGFCVLYDHPVAGLARHPHLFLTLFEALESAGHSFLPLSHFERVWRARSKLSSIAEWDGEHVHLQHCDESRDFKAIVCRHPSDALRFDKSAPQPQPTLDDKLTKRLARTESGLAAFLASLIRRELKGIANDVWQSFQGGEDIKTL